MSITLTTGKLVTINGVTQENDTTGGCVLMDMDYLAGTATFALQIGTLVNSNLSVGAYSEPVSIRVDLTTGNWTASTGQSGNVAGAALTNFVNQMKGVRNLIETFAAGASGIMPGTQVAW